MSFHPLHPKRQRRARSFPFLVILALATMLLSPLAEQVAMAQEDDQQEQEQQAEPTAAPLPTEPPVAVEEPPVTTEEPVVTEEVVVATEGPMATEVPTKVTTQDPTALTIAVHRCTDPPPGDWTPAMVVDQCDGPGTGTITVYSEVEPAAQTGSGGSLTFDVVGYLTIQETVEPGFDDPVVTCSLHREGSKVVGQIGPAEAPNGVWDIGPTDDRAIHCDWYQVPVDQAPAPDATPATGTPSRIVIQTSVCPDAMVDPAAGVKAVQDYCSQRMEGVSFRAMAEDGYDLTDVSSNSGTVRFEPVPSGAATITATTPDGYGTPIVFCQAISHSNATFAPDAAELVPVAEGRITREIKAGHDLSCQWFNVPETTTGTPVASPAASPAAEGTGSITIAGYLCPVGFDVTKVDANPTTTCAPARALTFTIDDAVDDNAGYYLETLGDGVGTLPKLPGGAYTIRQNVPNGVTATFVWDCYAAGGTSNLTDPVKIGGVIQLDLPPGYQVHCDWYNVGGGTSRVVINTLGCGVTVPAYTLTLEELRAQCTIDTGGIDFTVLPAIGGGRETRTASNNPLQLASFDNVPSGSITVGHPLPGGWGTPIVSCQVFKEDGLPLTDPAFMEFFAGRQINVTLEPGQVMGCDWFQVAKGNLEVRMIARTCPADLDAYAWADAPDTLFSYCTDKPDTVEFAIHDGGVFAEPRTATANAPAYWLSVPSGALRITESAPEGYGRPLVHCGTYGRTPDNNYFVLKQEMVNVGANATIQYNGSAGQLIQCVWFNVPGDTGYVSLMTQACPEGFDIHNASRIQFEQGCNEAIGNVDFSVASGSFTETATSTDRYPYIDFPAVPTGDLTVKQTSTTDYDTAVVYCYEQVQGPPVTPKERVEVSADRAVARPLEANAWQHCEWYLAHTPEGTITVTKWACPEAMPAGQERSAYQQKCTQTLDGVEFTVTGIASSSTQVTANGGTAQWTGIQPGLVTITEQIPHGYGQPVVFCTAPKMDRNFPVTDGTIEHELPAGGYLTCDWFNMPLEKGHVVVHKGACPEGTTGDHDAGWYLEKCAQPQEGIAFTLAHSAGNLQSTTDANGKVEWTDLPLGAFSLQERIPSGYGDPIVFCTDEGDTMLTGPASGAAPGGHFEGELTAGAKEIICRWYNIPAGHNSITIHKYTCPAGYDPSAWGANPGADCDEGPNGVIFSVAGAATGIEAATGDAIPHAVRFGDLPTGTYTVTEEAPAGIASTFVWDCTGQRMGELRPTPLATGPTLQLVLDGGEDVTCRWYNVLEGDPDAGRLTVIKYTCGTEAYVSEVDCEIEEGGVTFDLVRWNGDAWEYADTRTTDGAGTITWGNVDPGEYWLEEHDADWCQLTSEQISDDGNWLNVEDGQETVVKVYNCGGEPGKPGETPTKYPNTGVPPGHDDD